MTLKVNVQKHKPAVLQTCDSEAIVIELWNGTILRPSCSKYFLLIKLSELPVSIKRYALCLPFTLQLTTASDSVEGYPVEIAARWLGVGSAVVLVGGASKN